MSGKGPTCKAADRLERFIERLTGKQQLCASGLSGISAQKLEWLEDADRHFTDMGHEMPRQILRYLKAATARAAASPNPNAVVDLLNEAAKAGGKLVALRFRNGGGDAKPMRPLAASTVRRKGHADVGVDSGKLSRAIDRAGWFFVKVG